jgi:hypothetical protein
LADDTYQVHQLYADSKRSHRHSWVEVSSHKIIDSPPLDAVPADLIRSPNKFSKRRVFFRHQASPPTALLPPSCFSEYVATQPGHIRRLLRDCDLTDSGASTLVEAIYSTKSLFGGTDGGLLNGLGTFGFLWGSPELDNLILSGKGRVSGSSLSAESLQQ